MKQTFVTRPFPVQDWKSLSDVMKRHAALNGVNVYWGTFTTISHEENVWYVGSYHVRPFINNDTGKVFIKSVCQASGTMKRGRFYGNLQPAQMLYEIASRFPQFEFIRPIARQLSWPPYIVAAILQGKVTSQEDVWKLLAKRSYHDAHWKLVKMCKTEGISFGQLKLSCKDWEAFGSKLEVNDKYLLRLLITNAVILGEKVSCKWSEKRIQQELERQKKEIGEFQLAMMPDDPIYLVVPQLPNGWGMVNTEKEAYHVSQFFHNCVHNCYWPRIKQYQYLVFYNYKEELCVGYQIINKGEDVIFDQIHGKMNCGVTQERRKETLEMIGPIAQSMLQYTNQLPEETLPEETLEPDLPYDNIF